MDELTVSEARARLPEILDRIERGEEIMITRHGRAAAVLVRPDALRPRRNEAVFAQAREIRKMLPRVDQPLVIYKSRVDHVLGDRSLEIIRRSVRSPVEVVYLERSYHVATLDYDADLIFSGTSEFFTQLAAATE